MRRDAYEKFLSQADAAYRVLDEGWFALPFTELHRWEAGFAARRALDEAYIRVRLVGPDDVAERGAGVLRSIGDEFRLHARIVNDSPDTAGSAAELEPPAHSAALRARLTSTTEFVTVARRALGSQLSALTQTGPDSAEQDEQV
ncbi:hypothetical protein ACFYRY_23205 [Streptomyces sp. NPDC005263]|uniref:hypothetical protein n=1 Tax=Streptomyces sp. NPDC005263 TaxID=3364711 RepID=UPI0036C6930B